ncbi:unnamed protein product [Sphagnum jensenii]|uniref:Uncharacterized protein n=2 Tax=Sphagnum jensenii TaxID=128206 RepID=A0ABP0X733_9BRYO
MEQARRSKRQRVAVDYARLDTSGFADCMRVQHKKLTRAVLKFSNEVQAQDDTNSLSVSFLQPHELAPHVHSSGFANPCVVRASPQSRTVLGISVPEGEMTVNCLADLVGRTRHINTIDVSTQSEGPIYTMDEWATYFASPTPRKPLLNVVSLDLANTKLHDLVSAPLLVKELDLVNKAWPPSQAPTPMVQLYALMSVAGCFMDFHVDFGGSSVWYHVLSGSKVFLLVPPTKGNLMAFEEWSSSDKQASIFLADRASGCQKLELGAGDTLLLHTAAHYMALLYPQGENTEAPVDASNKVSTLEKEGLVSLCRCLDIWLRQSKDGCNMSEQIPDPAGLIKELESCLKKDGFVPAAGDIGTPTRIRLMLRPLSTGSSPAAQGECVPEEGQLGEEALDDKEDDEFSPTEGGFLDDDDQDDDFQVDDDKHAWSKRQCRNPHSKNKQTVPASPAAKPIVSVAPRTSPLPKKLTKSNSSVRDRLLKKCGLDPRIPLPSPKFKPKQREG